MSALPRRTFLSGLAALPVAGIPAVALASPEVADLAARYTAAFRRQLAALDARDAAEQRIVNPDPPEALYARANEPLSMRSSARLLEEGRSWFGDEDLIARWRALAPDHVAWRHAGAVARRNELIEAYDEWERAIRAAEDEAGFRVAKAEFVAADKALDVIRAEVVRLRSSDPAVLRLKLRVLADLTEWPEYLDYAIESGLRKSVDEPTLALSIARDLCSFDDMSA